MRVAIWRVMDAVKRIAGGVFQKLSKGGKIVFQGWKKSLARMVKGILLPLR